MSRFNVVAVDNYARETVDDVLVCNVASEASAKTIADLINADAGPNPQRWCEARPADKPLYRFEP